MIRGQTHAVWTMALMTLALGAAPASAVDQGPCISVNANFGKITACAVTVLYQSFVPIIVSESSGIKDLAGMSGKRVSLGSPGSSTEALAMRFGRRGFRRRQTKTDLGRAGCLHGRHGSPLHSYAPSGPVGSHPCLGDAFCPCRPLMAIGKRLKRKNKLKTTKPLN